MKKLLSVLLLTAAPVLFAAPSQSSPPPETAPQGSQSGEGNLQPQTNQATSHDRHMRRHRSGNRHHRPRTTSKGHRPH